MAPACWLFLAGGEERAMASASSTILEKAVPEYFSSFSYASGAFQTAALVLELKSEWVQVSLGVGPLRGTVRKSSSFCLPQPKSPLVFIAKVMGTYLPGTGTLGWGACCRAGTSHSLDIPPNFYLPQVDMGPACCAPSYQSQCGFFNSVVVGLPFFLIPGGSE